MCVGISIEASRSGLCVCGDIYYFPVASRSGVTSSLTLPVKWRGSLQSWGVVCMCVCVCVCVTEKERDRERERERERERGRMGLCVCLQVHIVYNQNKNKMYTQPALCGKAQAHTGLKLTTLDMGGGRASKEAKTHWG